MVHAMMVIGEWYYESFNNWEKSPRNRPAAIRIDQPRSAAIRIDQDRPAAIRNLAVDFVPGSTGANYLER